MDCGERTWYVCVLCGAVNMVKKHGVLVTMAAIVSSIQQFTCCIKLVSEAPLATRGPVFRRSWDQI